MISTSEEFIGNFELYSSNKHVFPIGTGVIIQQAMIEFTKLHVEAALKAKIEAMREEYNYGGYSLNELDSFTKNAYPLENIK